MMEGQGTANDGAFAGPAIDVTGGAQEASTITDGAQAHAGRAGRRTALKALAVIRDGEGIVITLLTQFHRHRSGAGMANGVAQGFLSDAIEMNGGLCISDGDAAVYPESNRCL